MSLPNYSEFRAVWVEKTQSSHEHGGEGWEFGLMFQRSFHHFRKWCAAEQANCSFHYKQDRVSGLCLNGKVNSPRS
jgi:hypothetical protein